MKNILFTLIIGCFLVTEAQAQMYAAFVPCMTTTVGNFPAKVSPAIEIGKQWNVFSMGFDIGKTNCSPVKDKKDTTIYLEFRPNLNIFQVGKFTNTFTPGIGYVFGSKCLMLELTAGLEYSLTEKLHINMFFGQYSYSGLKANSSVSFVGFSLMMFFKEYKTSSSILKSK